MLPFLRFGRKSKDEAKKRLTLILQYERQGIPPSLIDNLRKDIIGVLSKYPQIDIDDINLSLKGDREGVAEIYISIPVKGS